MAKQLLLKRLPTLFQHMPNIYFGIDVCCTISMLFSFIICQIHRSSLNCLFRYLHLCLNHLFQFLVDLWLYLTLLFWAVMIEINCYLVCGATLNILLFLITSSVINCKRHQKLLKIFLKIKTIISVVNKFTLEMPMQNEHKYLNY